MLTVVTGPPCSGKTTYVSEHRRPTDLVVDLDAIAHALGYPSPQLEWDTDHPALTAAQAARRAVLSDLPTHCGVWIVDTQPHPVSVRMWQRAGASFVALDPGRSVCRERATAAGRPADTLHQIDRWYAANS